jgi:hypothetical protein
MGDQEIDSLGIGTPEAANLTAEFQQRIVATVVNYRNALYENKRKQQGTTILDVRQQVEFDGAFLNHIIGLMESRLERWRSWRNVALDPDDIWDAINDSPGG